MRQLGLLKNRSRFRRSAADRSIDQFGSDTPSARLRQFDLRHHPRTNPGRRREHPVIRAARTLPPPRTADPSRTARSASRDQLVGHVRQLAHRARHGPAPKQPRVRPAARRHRPQRRRSPLLHPLPAVSPTCADTTAPGPESPPPASPPPRPSLPHARRTPAFPWKFPNREGLVILNNFFARVRDIFLRLPPQERPVQGSPPIGWPLMEPVGAPSSPGKRNRRSDRPLTRCQWTHPWQGFAQVKASAKY